MQVLLTAAEQVAGTLPDQQVHSSRAKPNTLFLDQMSPIPSPSKIMAVTQSTRLEAVTSEFQTQCETLREHMGQEKPTLPVNTSLMSR